MKFFTKSLLIFPLLAFGLTGCGNAKEQLGLERNPPDEFKVLKRAPLELPPNYALRPPKPGAPRPQEQEPSLQARSTVFGGEATIAAEPTSGEDFLLQEAGATNVQPDIRDTLDAETKELRDYNKPTAQKLLGAFGNDDQPSATIVDAPAEAERLRGNAEDGKPVTEGDTPSIEE